MNPTPPKKKITIQILFCFLLILCFVYLCHRVSASANKLASRNASDTLILLVELATESGDKYIQAKTLFAELLQAYAKHMEQRELYWLLRLPPFSKKNVVKELKRVADDLENTAQTNTRDAIDVAQKSIAEFLIKSKLFTAEPIVTLEPEVIPDDIQGHIRNSLDDTHKKTERYANNEQRTLDDARAVCMANRKAIVCLYLSRFNYQEIVDEEELRRFRTDINRTIYYNQVLQKTYEEDNPNYKLLGGYSDSELRRLGLLQAIIDNDIQQAQDLLQTVLIKAGIQL